jgi:hypothetical protein
MRADDSEADGVVTTLMGGGRIALRAIFEDKNEIGAGTCDPNLQGCISYMKFWSVDVVRVRSCYLSAKLTFLLSWKLQETSVVALRL